MADASFLPDFEPEEEDQEVQKTEAADKPKTQQYSGVHISGFRDFLLKPELNRAIQVICTGPWDARFLQSQGLRCSCAFLCGGGLFGLCGNKAIDL